MNMSKNIMRPLPSKYKESTGAQTRTNYLFFSFFFYFMKSLDFARGLKDETGRNLRE